MQTLFLLFAEISVLSGLFVVTARNPVNSVIALILCFLSIAGHYILLNAQFLAVVHIIVYTGAIMVLFLFVIMLLGVDRREPVSDLARPQTIAALVLGAFTLVFVLVLTAGNWTSGAPSANGALGGTPVAQAPTPPGDGAKLVVRDPGNIKPVAEALFTEYAWALQLTAVLLTLAVVGAVILAKRSVGSPVVEVYDAADVDAVDAIDEETTA